ncbi:MAG: hypothetical protein AAGC81_10990, partial [Pseudomonadota bacterium]
ELKDLKKLDLKKIGYIVGIPVVLTVLSLTLGLLDSFLELVFMTDWISEWGWAGVPLVGIASGMAIRWAYQSALELGRQSWPAAKFGSLTAVLKGLYTQQHFADFVIANQGASAKDLHKNFGAFLKAHKPSDELDPETTQLPGVIGSVARPRKNDEAA